MPDLLLVARQIAEAIQRLCRRVGDEGFVFTSGGIGPTHDDITYESVAAAFGRGVALHQPTVERMTAHYEAQGKEVPINCMCRSLVVQGSRVRSCVTT